MSHNAQTSEVVTYATGDSVFNKRKNKNEWCGPGVENGQVNQEVFV